MTGEKESFMMYQSNILHWNITLFAVSFLKLALFYHQCKFHLIYIFNNIYFEVRINRISSFPKKCKKKNLFVFNSSTFQTI